MSGAAPDPLDRIAHDELRDLDLTHLDEIARGWRRREYGITGEVRYACGEWLLQHSSDVLTLVQIARAARTAYANWDPDPEYLNFEAHQEAMHVLGASLAWLEGKDHETPQPQIGIRWRGDYPHIIGAPPENAERAE